MTNSEPPAEVGKEVSETKPDFLDGNGSTVDENSHPSGELSEFPHANLPDGYVGTTVCASCHPQRHESYLGTHHSRSLSQIDQAMEHTLDGVIEHRASWRRYEVVKKGDEIVHRESKRFGDGQDQLVKVNEFPVEYVMGSGAFAQGYLLRDGEYLLQSPVTWYAKLDDIGMAPGYDEASQRGFSRMIDDECLFCHAGLATANNDNPHQPEIHELAIGCERCHGPGQEHVAIYQSAGGQAVDGSLMSAGSVKNSKIVNPTTLGRVQLESVCAQCHLQAKTVVQAPGKTIWDFRPGEDLAKTQLYYKTEPAGDFDKVFVGHFDQMWKSPCYVQSETLTCVTCHDSHRDSPIDDPVAYRRDQCNQCHQDHGCSVEVATRQTENQNNCVSCHMPTLGSEVPHTSTTSHLIAVYEDRVPQRIEFDEAPFRRIQTQTTLKQAELARSDRLARIYAAIDHKLESDDLLDRWNEPEAIESLIDGGEGDAEVYSLLARLEHLRADRLASTNVASQTIQELQERSLQFASKAIELEKRPVRSREAAVELLGTGLMEAGQAPAAVRFLGELTQVRRVASDHYNLALALARLGRVADAEKLFREAIRVDGSYAPAYRSLSVLYRSVDPVVSKRAAEMAERLMAMPSEN
ncbi:hypothetical protein CGZ80_25010 [Rhodopirellula sp. MGV]|nr:hypothetical protein CGZ80_25010 [Rhodopirellula sp. MGV]